MFERLKKAQCVIRLLAILSSKPDSLDPRRTTMVLSRFVLVRLCLITIVLGFLYYYIFAKSYPGLEGKTSALNNIVIVTYILSLLNVYLIRRYAKHLFLVGILQFMLDVALVTVSLLVSGSSLVGLLYLLSVVASAFVFGAHGAIVIACAGAVGFAVYASDLVPGFVMRKHELSGLDVFLFYLVQMLLAFVASYVAKRFEHISQLLSQKSQEYKDLSAFNAKFFNDLSDAVVLLDAEGKVSAINHKALDCFGIENENLLSLPLLGVFRAYGLTGLDVLCDNKEENLEPKDLLCQLGVESGSVSLKVLNYTARNLLDSNSQLIGRVLIFRDVSHLRSVENQLRRHEQLAETIARDGATDLELISDSSMPSYIIGQSVVMRKVLTLASKVAKSNTNVLITGESGTGKELMARAIHDLSERSGASFVAINCSAIPEHLLESELFGHKKGAFTGAIRDNIGLFRQAHNGTLFLDEIGELAPTMQSKILRVIQERKVRSIGDTVDCDVDVRLVCATNVNLHQEIKEGRFREDLFYRINVVNIMLPALRDRMEDLPLLMAYFINKYADSSKSKPIISPATMAILDSYPFFGNVRELENIIERALVLGGGAILPEHLPKEVLEKSTHKPTTPTRIEDNVSSISWPIDMEESVESLEKRLLLSALKEANGVKTVAAKLLGLNFRSFRYRVKKYELEPPSPEHEYGGEQQF